MYASSEVFLDFLCDWSSFMPELSWLDIQASDFGLHVVYELAVDVPLIGGAFSVLQSVFPPIYVLFDTAEGFEFQLFCSFSQVLRRQTLSPVYLWLLYKGDVVDVFRSYSRLLHWGFCFHLLCELPSLQHVLVSEVNQGLFLLQFHILCQTNILRGHVDLPQTTILRWVCLFVLFHFPLKKLLEV